ncbi:MAG: lysylphosphatidylglycerol synthase transmembrane domain-containing protein [Gemmatimonadota bacterium]
MKQRVIIIVGVLISVVLLGFALRDVSPPELLAHLGEANLWWLAAATVAATGTFAIRAIRWRILLAPLPEGLPFRSRFAAVCIGFMVNNLLPARIGEFARAYSLSRVAPIGVTAVLASLVVERLLDGIVTVGLLLPAYFTLGPEALATAGPLVDFLTGFVILVGIGIVVAAVMVVFPRPVLAVVERLSTSLPERFAGRLTGIAESFITGLGVLRRGRTLAMAFAWTIVVWLLNAFSFYLGFLAFEIEEPGPVGAMMLQSMISLFVAIPSSPGFFGPFEFGARVGLNLYGIEPSKIISFAATYHILTFIPVTVLGIWYMRKLGITRKDIRTAGHESDPDVSREATEPAE